MYLVMLLVTVAIISTLHAKARSVGGGIFVSHLSIYSLLWLGLLSASILTESDYAINLQAYLVLCVAWIMLYFGHFIGSANRVNEVNFISSRSESYDYRKLKIALAIVCIFSIIANAIFYGRVGSALGSADSLSELRTTEGQEVFLDSINSFYSIFGRIYIIYLPISIYLYSRRQLSPFTLLFIFTIAILSASTTFTRAPLLFVIVIAFVATAVCKVRLNRLQILALALVGAAIIGHYTVEISIMNSEGDAVESFVSTLLLYTLGSLSAFSELLAGRYFDPVPYEFGYYSLDFLSFLLKKLSIIESAPPLIRTYAELYQTNVYSYLDVFVLDFGFFGAIIGPIIMGIVAGYTGLRLARSITIPMLVMYCYICYAMAISFMNNELIRSHFFIVLAIAWAIHIACKCNRSSSR